MKKFAFILFAALASCTAESDLVLAPTFVYHPAGRMVPFPSDRYLRAGDSDKPTAEKGTGFRIESAPFLASDPVLANFPGVSAGLDDLDGFGTSSEIAIEFTASPVIDERLGDEAVAFQASLEDSAPFVLISIDEKDPEAGKPLPYVARLETDGKSLFLRPWKPLRAAGWYAVVVKTGLRDAAGRAFGANEQFLADYRANRGEGLEGEGYARLKNFLPTTPSFAVTFRTASISYKLETLLDEIRALPASPVTFTTCIPGTDPNCGAGYNLGDVALLVEGWFKHRNYRNAIGQLESQVLGEDWIRFTITLPKTTATIHEPFPVVLGQHGLGDKRQAVLRSASGFARQGLATVAIDAPNHGSRGPGEGRGQDSLAGAREALGLWTDGEHLTFRAWQFRDIVRQQALDHLQILKVVQAWQEDLTRPTNQPGPDLDGASLTYTGQSMGGIIGGVSGSMLPELRRVVLNVPGGRISNILARNELLGNLVIELMRPRKITMSDAFRMVAVIQTILDPGDPVNYVHRIGLLPPAGIAPRPLLIQASLGDATVPNFTTYELARAAGAPLVGPLGDEIPDVPFLKLGADGISQNDARAFAFYRDIMVNGKAATADHGNLWASDTALSKAAHFLKTGVILAP